MSCGFFAGEEILQFSLAACRFNEARRIHLGMKKIFAILFLLSSNGSQAATTAADVKTVNSVFKVNVKTLDPAAVSDLYSGIAVAQIFESLYQFHYLKRPLQLEPALAVAMPTISKDKRTYTIHLKKGVYFHEDPAFGTTGERKRELKAQDVVYSWKRLADPKNMSEAYFLIEGKFEGLAEWAKNLKTGTATYDTEVSGLRAVDDHTLVIKLVKPFPQLAQVMAMPALSIVAREVVEKYGAEIGNHPVGSGPFRLVSSIDWIRNSKMTLRRNANYRSETYPIEGEVSDRANGLLKDAGRKLPLVDTLIFHELIEDQPRWQNGVTGKFDLFDIPNDNFASAVKSQTELSPELTSKGIALDVSPELGLNYIGFNMKDPIVGTNKKLRQAISLAFDSKVYIEKFLNGRGVPAQFAVPPGIDTYDPSFENPYRKTNIEKAKKLMSEAGFTTGAGPELTFDGLGDAKSRQIAEYVAYSVQPLGIKLKIRTSTFPELLKKMSEGKTQLYALGWGAVYPDPQAFFMAFYGPNRPPGPNGTSFQSNAYDALYDRAILMEPSKLRTDLYRKMRDILVEECVWVYNTHRLFYQLRQPWIKNYKPNEIALNTYKYLDVDTAIKTRGNAGP